MTGMPPPPQDPYSYPGGMPGGQPPRQGAQVFSIIAIICGVLAILILPIVFGPVGIALALVGRSRREPLWKVALGVAIGGMVLGFVLGAIVLSNS
jgi:hypothetical protein